MQDIGAHEDSCIDENGQLVEQVISNFLKYLSWIKNENIDEFKDMEDWGGLITLFAKI